MNPFNPEAGATPAPSDPAVVAIAERGAKIIWRAVPYLAWRYGARGLAFTRSDAGYLTTLVDYPPNIRDSQLVWLTRMLCPRGMPSLLLDAQLEILGRVGRRAAWPGAHTMFELAAHVRARREASVAAERVRACDALFSARTAGLPHTRSIGALLAAEVADVRLGHTSSPDATLAWLLANAPADPRWRPACLATRALAESAA